MKRCPKCNRSFPDENQKFCTVDGGLLIAATPPVDLNATIRATSAELGMPPSEPASERPTSRELPDPNATIAASAPTELFHRNTGRNNMPSTSELTRDISGPETVVGSQPPAAAPAAPAAPVSASVPAPAVAAAVVEKKKSKLPWILGGLLLLLLIGAGGATALFFMVVRPMLAEQQQQQVATEPTPATNINVNSAPANTNTQAEPSPAVEEFVPPAGTIKFENSKDRLDGKLAEHYVDFSFYYPENWQLDPKAGVPGASNFAKVERRLPPDFTQENFAVGWYTSRGTFERDKAAFPQLVEKLSDSLSTGFPEYRKVSEGPTKINSMDAYEFRFVGLSKGTEKGDLEIWGRVVFLPSGSASETAGATLVMLSTSLAPELSGVQDVGEKGQMPVILESFRFGKR